MDVKTALYNLREELSCTVCLDPFIDPKQLPCLHSFCLVCLQGLLKTSGVRNAVKCPICQRVCNIPDGGNLNHLPTSFYLNSMLDTLAIKECNTSNVKCGNCDQKSPQTFYCFQCCSFWCNDCITAHNIIRTNKGHRVLALKDFQEKDFMDVLKRPTFCQEQHHERKELEFFCKACERAVCHTCVVTLHQGHSMAPLSETAEEQKSNVKALVEAHQRKAQEMRRRLELLDQERTKTEQEGAEVKRAVQTYADNLHAVIESKKEPIFASVEHCVKESVERLTVGKNELESKVKMIEAAMKKTETLLERSTSVQIIELNKSLELTAEEVGRDEPAGSDTVNHLFLNFIENQKVLDAFSSEGIGYLQFFRDTVAQQSSAEGKGLNEAVVGVEGQFVLTTKDAKGRKNYRENDRVTVEALDEQRQKFITNLQITDNKNGEYRITYFVKEEGNLQLVVKVNGDHVCCSPFVVKVKCGVFRQVLTFGQKGSSRRMFDRPWGLAVNNRNEIAVTDCGNHRVQIFTSDGQYIRSFGREGTGQGEFKYPLGIVFTENNIFVADSSNHRVQIFSYEGRYVGQFGEKGNLDGKLSDPVGLSVDSDGNIIVADSGNKMIKIFSPNGKFLQKIDGGGCFNYLIHCVQYDKYVIVTDSVDHSIKVFDRKGKLMYKFGKQGVGDREFNYPRGLSVTQSGHLMVCDRLNHRVQVFELDGKFVTKFGKQGNNPGEFKSPVSVACLRNGRTVVCDSGNNRIQIFEHK